MANCCTGQTECNHIITIGYLKTFVGNDIQDSNGFPKTITHVSGDTYCPTYAELTGGTLVQNFVDGGNDNWASNVDGITVNGVYANNQCVKQEDLTLTYTRFDALSIYANPDSNVSECGGNSTLTYEYVLNKYVKALSGNCIAYVTTYSGSDASDTGDASINYYSNQSWATVSKPLVSIEKNGTHDSISREVTITGSLTFRGSIHSTSTTINQNALEGNYVFWKSGHTEYYSYDDLVISPYHFDCNGGDWNATGYYTSHDWDVYRWQDSCGVTYDDDTENRNDTYTPKQIFVSSGSAELIDCETLTSDYHNKETIEWNGLSAWWEQECKSCLAECPCGETCRSETINTGGTIHCSGGSVDITYDFITISATCDPSTGERTETLVESGSGIYYATVTADCNSTSSQKELPYGVIQEAGPCCPTADVYTFDEVIVSCSGASAETKDVNWTRVHTNADKTITTTTGTTSKQILSAECNPTNAIKILQNGNSGETTNEANPQVTQLAGPCCCVCDDITVTSIGSVSSNGGNGIIIATYNADTCVASLLCSTNENWVSNISLNNGNIIADVSQYTITTGTGRTATVTITGSADGTSCAKTFDLIQTPVGCTCNMLTISPVNASWEWDSSANSSITVNYDECITNITTNALTYFNVSSAESTNSIVYTISPKTNNTSENDYVETFTISYSANGTSCSSGVSLTQVHRTCSTAECTCYLVGVATSSTVPSTATTATITWPYTAVTWNTGATCNVSSSSTIGTSSTTINIEPSTCENYTKSGSYTWVDHKACDGNNACTNANAVVEWSLTQERPSYCDCTCGDLTLNKNYETWEHDSTSAKLISVTSSNCISNISLSNPTDFNVSLTSNAISISPKAVNTGLTSIVNTLIVSYTSHTSTCSSAITLTQQEAPCDCNRYTVTTDTTMFPITGGSITVFDIEHECGTIEATSANCSNLITAVTVSAITASRTKIIAKANANTTTNDVNCSIGYVFKPNASSSCTSAVTVTLPACNCSRANISASSSGSIPGTGGTNITVAQFTASCTNNISVYVSGSSEGLSNLSLNGNTIKADFAENPSTSTTRTYTIGIKIGNNTCAYVNITQIEGPCHCYNFALTTPDTVILGYSAGSSGTVEYSGNCQDISVNIPSGATSWLGYSINQNTKEITFSAKTVNTSMLDYRTATVVLSEPNTIEGTCELFVTVRQSNSPVVIEPNCSVFNREYNWDNRPNITVHDYE